MVSSYMNYGAMTTKVRAMYGKTLSVAQFEQLVSQKSVADAVSFLRETQSFGTAAGALPYGETNPAAIEAALHRQVADEYNRLRRFGSSMEKLFLVLAAQRGELGIGCYTTIFRELKRSGDIAKPLLKLIALEADLLNINSLLRLHHSFPASLPNAQELLIPVKGQLSPELVERLIAAHDEDEARVILGNSVWSKYYPRDAEIKLERQFENIMEAFCRKLITMSEPNPCMAQSYISLREIERDRVIRIIEAIHYGIDPHKVL